MDPDIASFRYSLIRKLNSSVYTGEINKVSKFVNIAIEVALNNKDTNQRRFTSLLLLFVQICGSYR